MHAGRALAQPAGHRAGLQAEVDASREQLMLVEQSTSQKERSVERQLAEETEARPCAAARRCPVRLWRAGGRAGGRVGARGVREVQR